MAKKSGFNYFDSFISMANHAYEAAQYLDGIVKNFDPNPTVLLERCRVSTRLSTVRTTSGTR